MAKCDRKIKKGVIFERRDPPCVGIPIFPNIIVAFRIISIYSLK
jgi:hypothetical protein